MVINCDTDETRKISLCEYGIITSGRYTDFYTGIIDPTGKNIIVVNGMSEDDRAKLKDISFNEVKVDGTLATLQKYALSISLSELDKNEYDEDAYDTVNGTKIYYQSRQLSLKVSYGKTFGESDDESYLKVAELASEQGTIKVTLKYISVNKSIAYGGSQIRYATKVENNNEISIESWAGTTGTRPFKLIPGYSTATSYPTEEELNVSDNTNKTGSVLRYRINSTESGASGGLKDFATIDETTGKIILGKDFDRANNYLAIDIGIAYGSNEIKYIDTVKIAVYNPVAEVVQQNYRNLVVKEVGGEYTASVSDIYNLITITDTNGNDWSGEDLKLFANDTKLTVFLNGDPANNLLTMTGEFTFKLEDEQKFSIGWYIGDSFEIDKATIIDSYIFVGNRFVANSLNNNGIIKFNFGNEVLNIGQIITEITKNVEFIDIYGQVNNGITFAEKTAIKTTGYLYEVSKNGTKVTVDDNIANINKNQTYTISFLEVKDNEVVIGSVDFIIRSVSTYKEVIEKTKGSDFEVFADSKSFTYVGYYGDEVNGYTVTLPNTIGATIDGTVKINNGEFAYSIDEDYITITLVAEELATAGIDLVADEGKVFEIFDTNGYIVGMFVCTYEYTHEESAKNIFDRISEYYQVDKADLQVRISEGEGNVRTLSSDELGNWALKVKDTTASDFIKIQIYQTLPQTTSGAALELIYYELVINLI